MNKKKLRGELYADWAGWHIGMDCLFTPNGDRLPRDWLASIAYRHYLESERVRCLEHTLAAAEAEVSRLRAAARLAWRRRRPDPAATGAPVSASAGGSCASFPPSPLRRRA